MENTVRCQNCGQLNRLPNNAEPSKGRCGSCGISLSPKHNTSDTAAPNEVNSDLVRLKEWEERLEFIENSFKKFNLDEIKSIREHAENRIWKESIWVNRRATSKKYQIAFNKIFDDLTHKKLSRILNRGFRDLLLYKIDDKRSVDAKRHLPLESNFHIPMSAAAIDLHNARQREAGRNLQEELKNLMKIGSGGLFSGKPSKAKFEKKEKELVDGIQKIHFINKSVETQYERNERVLLKLCEHAIEFYKEISSLEAQIRALRSKLHTERTAKRTTAKLALAAAAEGRVRQESASFRQKLPRSEMCPYCGSTLGSNPHLDHIYPVSRGGLNTNENLIYCCNTCNIKKADKGLYQFCKENGLNYLLVVERLTDQGKHV